MANEIAGSIGNGKADFPSSEKLRNEFSDAFKIVNDVVLKNYITSLRECKAEPLDESMLLNNVNEIRMCRITEMVYGQNEAAAYKFASVFNAVAATESAIVTVIDSDGDKTDFYLGIRTLSEKSIPATSYQALINAMQGQFPGTKIKNLQKDDIERFLGSIDSNSLSSVSCVANNKNKEFVNNDEYLQGLEKLAAAMQGKRYTAVIIANPASQDQINMVRQSYEDIYTRLSPFANSVVNYGTNKSETKGTQETNGQNNSTSHSENQSMAETEGQSKNVGETKTLTEKTLKSKIGSTVGMAMAAAGAAIGSIVPGVGTAVGATVGGAIGTVVGAAVSAATDQTVSVTTGGGTESSSKTNTRGQTDTLTKGTSHSIATSLGLTTGESQNLQLTIQNKRLADMLDRIDKQLTRLDEFESVGMWECAAYFMSADYAVSEVAASTYKALMSGEDTGVEVSAINTWMKSKDDKDKSQNEIISDYVKNFIHPIFQCNVAGNMIPVTPASLVSGNELAIHMGLPRKSVCGFPVMEHADFGKEVVKYDRCEESSTIELGHIFNMGEMDEKNNVSLDVESLSMHTFIVGSTGSGKSNTIYRMLDSLAVNFMVIEPAKGEYKRIFGRRKDVSVFGTNPQFTELLRINPFKFPKNIHVLEHVDRLIEIFNVCWPMYAAMPAVLKDAVIGAYESCGWDTSVSRNFISDDLFPSFKDLQDELVKVINSSEYSDEVKSNYKGSLLTRVKSLTNGLNGMIFAPNEIDNKILFDTNVIVDLSRIGSQETKALLMGLLVMRLSEYRMDTCTESNSKLKHITVLEEAHNILRNSSSVHSVEDGADIAGKSVEMISNAIAEMRTYGEGFIIADQSPEAVDISAIRNTNTKIIMRLPEESDRRLAGKAAALKDAQIDEIAKLPKGVAVVYQNEWVEPVLCKINKSGIEEKEYKYVSKEQGNEQKKLNMVLCSFVAKNRLDSIEDLRLSDIESAIKNCNCSAITKIRLYTLLKEYRDKGELSIWHEDKFAEQSKLVQDILCLEQAVPYSQKVSSDQTEFRCFLNTLISRKLDSPSEDMILAMSHCLMKAYSCMPDNQDKGVELYKKWHDELAEGVVNDACII